jgi:ribosomal protein L18
LLNISIEERGLRKTISPGQQWFSGAKDRLRHETMIKHFNANKARLRRHQRIRRRVNGSPARPRLNVFRSGKHIYAQIIDDSTGRTLAAASSLDVSLRDFKPAESAAPAQQPQAQAQVEEETPVEVATESAPARGRSAKAPARGGQQQKGAATKGRPAQQTRTVLPAAQKGAAKTPVEALAAIASNRKVALAREVGKLVARRAKEKGVSKVVFDRGGYTYHGRVASLAEGAREAGLDF